MAKIDRLFDVLLKLQGSDLHLLEGEKPKVRVHGRLEPIEKETQDTVVKKVEEEKDLVEWSDSARPFKRRNKQFWVTVCAIAAVAGLILLLTEGFIPVILIISGVFLYYVLSTVEPEKITYKITNRGIKIVNKITTWDQMGRFWITRRFDNELLVVETATLVGRLELVVPSDKKEEITKALSKYLTHEQVPASGVDRAATWFSKKLPGNA